MEVITQYQEAILGLTRTMACMGKDRNELEARNAALATKWEKEANAYQVLVEESRRAGTPHDQMLSMMTALRACAKELRTTTP